jgi:hypothetical protein
MLRALSGIDRVVTNIVTGSVVIYYDTEAVTPEAIIQHLQDQGYFDADLAVSHDIHVQNVATRAGFKLGRMAFSWALGKTLEANGLSLLAAII